MQKICIVLKKSYNIDESYSTVQQREEIVRTEERFKKCHDCEQNKIEFGISIVFHMVDAISN